MKCRMNEILFSTTSDIYPTFVFDLYKNSFKSYLNIKIELFLEFLSKMNEDLNTEFE
jgi:hypothetical protein